MSAVLLLLGIVLSDPIKFNSLIFDLEGCLKTIGFLYFLYLFHFGNFLFVNIFSNKLFKISYFIIDIP